MLFIVIISTIAVFAPHTEMVASDMQDTFSTWTIDSRESKATAAVAVTVEKTESPSNNDDTQLPQNQYACIREDEATEGQFREA